MMRIVEAVAALDAQPAVVGRAVAALDEQDVVVLDVVGELAADAAIRADRLDLLVGHLQCHLARRHQRAGGAGLHALAAGHAGGLAHRVAHVEHDLLVSATEGQADHVVDLLVAAGTLAAGALDAGIEVDRDGGVREIGSGLRARLEARLAHVEPLRPFVELAVAGVGLLGHVGKQQLEHHLLRGHGTLARAAHLHARCGRAAAGGCEHALARDLDHAGAAVAGRRQPILVAQMGDFDAMAQGRLPDGFATAGRDRVAVQGELDVRGCVRALWGWRTALIFSCSSASRYPCRTNHPQRAGAADPALPVRRRSPLEGEPRSGYGGEPIPRGST